MSGRGPLKYFAFGVRPGAPVASVLPSPGLCHLGLPGQGLAPQGPSSALPPHTRRVCLGSCGSTATCEVHNFEVPSWDGTFHFLEDMSKRLS